MVPTTNMVPLPNPPLPSPWNLASNSLHFEVPKISINDGTHKVYMCPIFITVEKCNNTHTPIWFLPLKKPILLNPRPINKSWNLFPIRILVTQKHFLSICKYLLQKMQKEMFIVKFNNNKKSVEIHFPRLKSWHGKGGASSNFKNFKSFLFRCNLARTNIPWPFETIFFAEKNLIEEDVLIFARQVFVQDDDQQRGLLRLLPGLDGQVPGKRTANCLGGRCQGEPGNTFDLRLSYARIV